MPVVALPLLSLFIDIKSAASDVRFRGECVAKLFSRLK
jgi:hypothetical protein